MPKKNNHPTGSRGDRLRLPLLHLQARCGIVEIADGGVRRMNEKELIGKIDSSMYHQIQTRGYAAPVDVLIDTGILPKQKYEDWRFGRVRYLEAVCNANLKRLSFVLHQMRVYAQTHDLKPSFCYYKRWGVRKKNGTGHKPVIPLQFSKSGSPEIERSYATHFVDLARVQELKAAQPQTEE